MAVGRARERFSFKGLLTEVRLWGICRSELQIVSDMMKPLTSPLTEAGLALYFPASLEPVRGEFCFSFFSCPFCCSSQPLYLSQSIPSGNGVRSQLEDASGHSITAKFITASSEDLDVPPVCGSFPFYVSFSVVWSNLSRLLSR
jgi:hypothetical protein